MMQLSRPLLLLQLLTFSTVPSSWAFQPAPSSSTSFFPQRLVRQSSPCRYPPPHPIHPQQQQIIGGGGRTSTSLNFMGSESAFLGIGGPEVFTILLVGYFILGPSDLYKLVKEVGKFLQNIRTFSNDLSTTFESSMENSLQLAEIRKAQRELNDAFSFRRSINVDENSEAFSVEAGSAQAAEAAAASASVTPGAAAVTGKTPKKIRRRVRRKAPTPSAMAEDETLGTVPMDLEMPQPSTSVTTAATLTTRTTAASESSFTEQELAEIEREFNQYVESPLLSSSPTTTTTTADNSDSDALMTTNVLTPEQNRFQQQLSGQWNEQILSSSSSSTANATTSTLLSNALTPEDEPWFMETIRKQMALLEQEKQNRLRILEEEYERKKDIEQEFYWKQRSILEEAVQSVASTTTTVAPGSDTNNKNAPVTATVAAATKTTTSESQSQ